MICKELPKKTKRLRSIFTHVPVKPGVVHIGCVILIFLQTDIFAALSIAVKKDVYIIINTEDCLFPRIKGNTDGFEKTH